MRTLQFDYEMKIRYSVPVSVCHFTIKCFPCDSARQKVFTPTIRLEPEIKYSKGADSFGNRQIYGCVKVPHDSFSFHVSGKVHTGCSEFEFPGASDESRLMIFRNPYGRNKPGQQLVDYFSDVSRKMPEGGHERCRFLMHRLYQEFSYEKGCTGMETGAEQAWKQGKGVCQDYSHIYIALLHMAGIPARYVTGFLMGEGESHAWVEAFCDGKWYGFDPTNDTVVTDSHIRIGTGRDAGDCLINRGVLHGGGTQTQEIHVSVYETGK